MEPLILLISGNWNFTGFFLQNRKVGHGLYRLLKSLRDLLVLFETPVDEALEFLSVLAVLEVTCGQVVLGVIAMETVDSLFVEVEDFCYHMVQEATIMGHNKQG